MHVHVRALNRCPAECRQGVSAEAINGTCHSSVQVNVSPWNGSDAGVHTYTLHTCLCPRLQILCAALDACADVLQIVRWM